MFKNLPEKPAESPFTIGFEDYHLQRSEHGRLAQNLLDQLEERFSSVEIKQMIDSKKSYVRIVIRRGTNSMPLATIGQTVQEAANRMLMVTQLYE